jgi:hypothetical protein
MARTIHLVYPHRPRISAPDSIGYQLGQRLAEHHPVKYYDWDESQAIKPAPGDVLIGHAHPAPWTCFRRSLKHPGWQRVLMLEPYAHGDNFQVAFLDTVIGKCDLFLAITGNYWFESIGKSIFSHWRPKVVHLDLAVDRQDFPPLRTAFNPAGQRRFLYIGLAGKSSNTRYKNTEYLTKIARVMPELQIGWLGRGQRKQTIDGLFPLGFQDFSTESGQRTVASYDFMITVGKADANPTTILEAMAWGLIPVCTPQSGYNDYPGIVNIPLGDVQQAVAILRGLQEMPEVTLCHMQALNWEALDRHFNWDRFAQQVIDAIESDVCPALDSASWQRKLLIRWSALISPISPWRPHNLARLLARRMLRPDHRVA